MDPARQNEEQATQHRAAVLKFAYTDTTTIQKQLYKDILSVPELYQLKVVPLVADEHYIQFGITTTTSQQTLNALHSRFTDQRISFSIISETGMSEYMKLYDPPKKVEYGDISITEAGSEADKRTHDVSATLDSVRPDDMLAYLVQQAYQLKASDIHLENQRENIRVRFRVDGVLHPV
ncbi:MAG: hypothetical protein JWO96_497, partial [Candidatus Saccharibacteria bacterium]|nr:hypothetical protein [Candidatus Saccharibacteria bacterium]